MRQTSSVLFIAVDSLIPVHGKSIRGFDEFTSALDHAKIPAVWLTARSRHHLEAERRKLGHAHPFIAEDGCAIYLPQDYFHLRPASASSHTPKTPTLRLGRFHCVPVAERLPAASDALQALSADTRVPIVTLRSLSTRELVQNTGLPEREAELHRLRDFDELFFFAGASDKEIHRFFTEGRTRRLEFRQHGVLWSAAIGASTQRCIRELSHLYDRALHYHARSVGVATANLAQGLFPFCSRTILLADRPPRAPSNSKLESPQTRQVQLQSPEVWELLLRSLSSNA